MNTFDSLKHTTWECKYHVVFIPKYRKKVLYQQLRRELGTVFRELVKRQESEVLEGHLMADHVHMLLSIPPKHSVSAVMGFVKGKSAIHVARVYAGRRRSFVGQHFWARGYWVSTVGKNEAAVRRFYERLGGLIAAAYLMKAVDCHRENVIAAGEYPVLVDIDALWHVSALTKTQSQADVLYRTGFFPNSRPASLQSRSSVLGKSTTGKHLARMAGKPVSAAPYTNEIIAGFSRAWNCILGTANRRTAFLRIVRRVRSHRRRWIYRATESYGAVLQASIQPSPLRSTAERRALITSTCSRRAPTTAVAKAEIDALMRLDLPYFVRKTNHAMPSDKNSVPSELTGAIRAVLERLKNAN
jgi:putative transposase